MKKTTLLLFVLITSVSFSQWTNVSPITQGRADAIHFFDGQTGLVGGGALYPLKTTDGGSTWNSVSTQSARDFSFLNNTTGYCASIVSHSMSKTVNGGTSWTAITPPTSNSLWAVATTSVTTAHFVGTGGVYWRTVNGGSTVTVETSGASGLLTDIVFTNSSTGFIVEQTGKIRKSTTSGNSWNVVHTISSGLLTEMCFVNSNVGFVVGTNGMVIKTQDAGQTWTQLTTNSTAYLQGVHFYDVNHGIAVGLGGTILSTENGGANWSLQNSGITTDLYDVRMLSATSAIVIGDSGVILRNTNITTLGLEENDVYSSITLYPNPTTDLVQLTGLGSEETTYQILDEKGASLSAAEKLINGTFSMEAYSKGVYYIQIHSGANVLLKKVIRI